MISRTPNSDPDLDSDPDPDLDSDPDSDPDSGITDSSGLFLLFLCL